jgi:hypothetical protein
MPEVADLEHLVFLPRGDAALTRRARNHSRLSAVVVRFSRARKRYERQGVLVEEAAIDQAEAECLAHAEARARRRERERERRAGEDVEFEHELAREITRLFPGCPQERAERIARHTGERGSGRVGRTAGARAFDPAAVTLAVVAAVRHGDTAYDDLLMEASTDQTRGTSSTQPSTRFSNSGARRSRDHDVTPGDTLYHVPLPRAASAPARKHALACAVATAGATLWVRPVVAFTLRRGAASSRAVARSERWSQQRPGHGGCGLST